MAIETIKQLLMRRDGLTAQEADDQVAEGKQILAQLIHEERFVEAYDICEELFGIEPDYLIDLME